MGGSQQIGPPGQTRAHGTRACYVFGPGPGQDRSAGCRCEPCCDANRAYARMQRKRKSLEGLGRESGPWASPFTDAAPVRERIFAFAERGIGYKRLAELAGVSKSSLLAVRTGKRDRVRRELASAVLAVPLDADVADGQLVDATETWQLIDLILRRKGWSKARISAELGGAGRALQLGDERVTAGHARAIAALADRLDVVAVADARRFPVAPLLARHSIKGLERRTGIDERQFHRWKHSGVPYSRADEIAGALGSHPVELWPDWYDGAAAATG